MSSTSYCPMTAPPTTTRLVPDANFHSFLLLIHRFVFCTKVAKSRHQASLFYGLYCWVADKQQGLQRQQAVTLAGWLKVGR